MQKVVESQTRFNELFMTIASEFTFDEKETREPARILPSPPTTHLKLSSEVSSSRGPSETSSETSSNQTAQKEERIRRIAGLKEVFKPVRILLLLPLTS